MKLSRKKTLADVVIFSGMAINLVVVGLILYFYVIRVTARCADRLTSDLPGRDRHCSSSCWWPSWPFSGGFYERHRIRGQCGMKSYVAPFFIALITCAALFLLLDLGVMNLMGLTLFFNP